MRNSCGHYPKYVEQHRKAACMLVCFYTIGLLCNHWKAGSDSLSLINIGGKGYYKQRCKNTTSLHEQGMSQNNFTQKVRKLQQI